MHETQSAMDASADRAQTAVRAVVQSARLAGIKPGRFRREPAKGDK
jgi:hypothetical protein